MIPAVNDKGHDIGLPVAFTTKEGGDWINTSDKLPDKFAALRFQHGQVYDAVLANMGRQAWR